MLDGSDNPVLHIYLCGKGHRVIRRTENNNSSCSRCNGPFTLLASLPRNEGESHETHHVRSLFFRKPKVQ